MIEIAKITIKESEWNLRRNIMVYTKDIIDEEILNLTTVYTEIETKISKNFNKNYTNH